MRPGTNTRGKVSLTTSAEVSPTLIFRSWKAARLCPKEIRGNPTPLLPSVRLVRGWIRDLAWPAKLFSKIQREVEGLSRTVGLGELCPYHLVLWGALPLPFGALVTNPITIHVAWMSTTVQSVAG